MYIKTWYILSLCQALEDIGDVQKDAKKLKAVLKNHIIRGKKALLPKYDTKREH